MNSREECPMRHTNGNCLVIGGFCTSVNDEICNGLRNAYAWGALREMRRNKWVSVKDRMPPPREPCITATSTLVYFGWYLPEGKCWIVDDEVRTDVYAWMPLPEPPKEVSE